MRKLLAFFTVFTLVFAQFNLPASAQEINQNKINGLNVNYEEDLGHENRTKDEIVTELLSEGVPLEDAEFYAKLDILANQMEINNIELTLDDVETYSNSYVKANPNEIREQALALDKRALTTLLKQHQNFADSTKEVDKINKFNEEFNKTNNASPMEVIEIKYADGSSTILETSTVKDNEGSDSVSPQVLLRGPWNKTADMDNSFNAVDNAGGSFTTTWRFFAGISYASVTDVLKWKFGGKSDLTIDYISDSGASS